MLQTLCCLPQHTPACLSLWPTLLLRCKKAGVEEAQAEWNRQLPKVLFPSAGATKGSMYYIARCLVIPCSEDIVKMLLAHK